MSLSSVVEKREAKVKEFGIGDKIGYGLGDLGCGAFFQFISSYLMLFYTDILGISATSVATLFVVARVWDAIMDIIMGVILDKATPTKYGKFRPYVLWCGVPMIISGVICFMYIPSISEGMKLPFAYVTYIIFGMLYTAVNIPYGSLASVMTTKSDERTSLSTFRNIGTILSSLVVMVLVPKLIFQNEVATAVGFLRCSLVFAVISIVSFILTFKLTRERITNRTVKKEDGNNMKEVIKNLIKNRAFVGVTLMSLTMMSSTFLYNTLNAYLYKEYFHRVDLIAVAGVAGIIAMFAVIPFVGKLAGKFGKKEITIAGLLLSMIVYGGLFFINIKNPYLYIVLYMIANLGTGMVNAVIWALVGDAIDYQEYISGERNEGVLYSSYSLFRKLSQAISGGIGGFALAALGYKSGVEVQIESVGAGVKNIVCGGYVIGLGISLLIMIFVYNLSKSKLSEVSEELNKRRNLVNEA